MLQVSILFGIFSIIFEALLRVEKYCQKENRIMKKMCKYGFIITAFIALV